MRHRFGGPGFRPRLTTLIGLTAALLLVPAASAFADVPAKVVFTGEGSGWVKGVETGGKPTGGEPKLECHWDGNEIDEGMNTSSTGPESAVHECEVTAKTVSGITGITLKHEADEPGSEFGGWEILEGTRIAEASCRYNDPSTGNCGAVSFGQPYIEVQATFNLEPPHWALNLTPEGGGSGSFECDIGSGPEACEAEYLDGTEVEVLPVAGTGSEFTEFTGDCSGSSCNLTMDEEHSVGGVFSLESVELSVTESGEGTVECEVNSTPASCNGIYTYGDSVVVSATPDAENVVGSMTGSGSAAGSCTVASEGASGSCAFDLEGDGSVDVLFESAGTKATTPATVEGEVPITTSLEGCASPVVLGPFVPAVPFNYEGTCTVIATSSGSEAQLSADDADETATKGHLVQGSYSLPSALETRANGLAGIENAATPGSYESLENTVTLLSYGGPVSADNVTVHFKQHIGLHDALHTGTYSKTITLTLEQTP